ncbi:hypothetical protein ACFPK9_13320 [Rubritalea spongiae]|uniref:Copper resistance protein B n=1 Tax=Rubritalea spongiae TaxID=430797 RepID=A0ABW5E1I1_9BACT
MNNKTTLSLLGGALLSGSAYAGPVVAPEPVTVEPGYEASVSVGVHSDYIWRGLFLGRALVDSSVEASTSAWGLDFAGGLWAGNVEEESFDDEINAWIEGSKDFGWARFTTGYIYYDFFDGETNNAHEVYFGLSKDLCWGFNASYTYFWDVYATDNDGYNELVLGNDTDVFGYTLDTTLTTGFLFEGFGASHITLKTGYDWELTDHATLTPYLAYTWELAGLERYAAPMNGSGRSEQNRFFGGVSLSVSF